MMMISKPYDSWLRKRLTYLDKYFVSTGTPLVIV